MSAGFGDLSAALIAASAGSGTTGCITCARGKLMHTLDLGVTEKNAAQRADCGILIKVAFALCGK
jgi:hypothetical protein